MGEPSCKRCSRCRETKPLDQFYRSAKGTFGRQGYCKVCAQSRSREWRAEAESRACARCEQRPRVAYKAYCRECAAEMQREYEARKRASDPEWSELEAARHRRKAKERYHHRGGKQYGREWRWRKLGLTRDVFSAMETAQDGVCAICGGECEKGGLLSVDHCHETGRVRGLLCRRCNAGLGYFRDNPAWLRTAALYLEKHERTAPETEHQRSQAA